MKQSKKLLMKPDLLNKCFNTGLKLASHSELILCVKLSTRNFRRKSLLRLVNHNPQCPEKIQMLRGISSLIKHHTSDFEALGLSKNCQSFYQHKEERELQSGTNR